LSNGIVFEEKYIDGDPVAKEEFVRRRMKVVPSFLIGDKIVTGLNKKKILSLLDYTVINCVKCNVKMRIPKDKGKIKITCPKCQNQIIKET